MEATSIARKLREGENKGSNIGISQLEFDVKEKNNEKMPGYFDDFFLNLNCLVL